MSKSINSTVSHAYFDRETLRELVIALRTITSNEDFMNVRLVAHRSALRITLTFLERLLLDSLQSELFNPKSNCDE